MTLHCQRLAVGPRSGSPESGVPDTPIYQAVLERLLRAEPAESPKWPAVDPDRWDGPTVSRFPMPAELFIDWPQVEHTPGTVGRFRPAIGAPGEWTGWAA